MTTSAEILTNFEHCQRWGYWSLSWKRHRLSPIQAFHESVHRALTEDVADPGDHAGSIIMTLATERGLEIPSKYNKYECAINHAAIADLVVTAIRQGNGERWRVCDQPRDGWASSVRMDPAGGQLRRFLAVSHWSEEREYSVKHSWYVLGEIAHFELPMQLVIAVLGPTTGGRRQSAWAKGLLHPQLSELRFRRRRRAKIEGFRETWLPVYREQHAEISRERWLSAMHADDVLRELLFVVNVAVPEPRQLATIRDLAWRQRHRLHALEALPERQLATCLDPIHPCPFRSCCWSDPQVLPQAGVFDPVEAEAHSEAVY